MPKMHRYEGAGAVWSDDLTSISKLRERADITGSLGLTTGPRGRPAATFPAGGTAYADFGDLDEMKFSSGYTAMAWVYVDSDLTGGGTNHHVFSKWIYTSEGWAVRVQDGNAGTTRKISLLVETAGGARNATTTGQVFLPRQWQHVAITQDGTTVAIYLDGVSQTLTSGVDGLPISGTQPFRLGSNSQSIVGNVSDAVVFDRALSADEISAVHAGTVWDYDQYEQMHLTQSNINDKDISHAGNGYDMTGSGLVASTDIVPGPFNGEKAVEYNGTDEWMTRTTADWRSGDTAGTVFAWVKRASTAGANTIFSSSDNGSSLERFTVYVRAAGTDDLFFYMRNTAGVIHSNGGGDLSDVGVWHAVAVAGDGTIVKLFVDGVEVVSTAGAGWLNSVADRDNVSIGVELFNGINANEWDGQIGQVLYFNTNLLPIQLADLISRTQNGVPNDIHPTNTQHDLDGM